MDIQDLSGTITSRMGDMSERVTSRAGDLSKRTAGAMKRQSMSRDLSRLTKRLQDAESALESRMDLLADQLDDLGDLTRGGRTSWPRRLFWMVAGAGLGAGIAYLADPDRGPQRRRQLSEQMGSRAQEMRHRATEQARELGEQVGQSARDLGSEATEQASELGQQARRHAGQLREEAAERAGELRRETEQRAGQMRQETERRGDQVRQETSEQAGRLREQLSSQGAAAGPDSQALEERIRTEVLGRRDDVTEVVVRVEEPGRVALAGTVPSDDSLRDLVDSVRNVNGVTDVRSELSVRHG